MRCLKYPANSVPFFLSTIWNRQYLLIYKEQGSKNRNVYVRRKVQRNTTSSRHEWHHYSQIFDSIHWSPQEFKTMPTILSWNDHDIMKTVRLRNENQWTTTCFAWSYFQPRSFAGFTTRSLYNLLIPWF